jgi:hypothetical protein
MMKKAQISRIMREEDALFFGKDLSFAKAKGAVASGQSNPMI